MNKRKIITRILVIIFWLAMWHLASLVISTNLIFPSPVLVLKAFIDIVADFDFLKIICFSLLRIIAGFLLGLFTGIITGAISFKSSLANEILSPIIRLMKTVPVASFIIIALVFIGSKNLSILTGFIVVMPNIHINTIYAMKNTDEKLLEMAKVFRISKIKEIIYIYIPEWGKYMAGAIDTAISMCIKAAIAAEIIGVPTNSIGEAIYMAKIYLNAKELFAWTAIIVIVSIIFEKIFMFFYNKLFNIKVPR